ncbi:EamA family transporter [Bacillus sp. S70]|uniref:DMT family transporter n=1 Tax=unclassified Bacillus (in: firmicutes) TaxID=185979 RepID=UPI00190BA65D|nr:MULTISPECIES: DMT family transporter [unclassified Bacillus (in: firmicutes)]MBJ9980872.1 EamA family transporter [Bacillus sp. S29]MBK0102546.1 EamA family transporter [Bacillus sp. S70]MBK0106063.1 EamA family transporter [Bacillus sp. S73]MBK0135450.1 EamA family transporter [Bacillus sp. S72]MBK0150266.1 EamA family transporter [Bacillus sp. S74]
MHNKKWDLRIICAHAFTILIWGTAFPAIRMGLESYTPEHLTLLRLLIASFILLLFSFIYKLRLPDLKDIPAIFIFGALGFTIYHIVLNYGEKTVNAGSASLIISVTPIVTAILASVFLNEKMKLNGWIGGVMSFAGIALISFSQGDAIQLNSGGLFILLAAISESLFFVFQTSYLKKYGFLPFTIYTILSSTVCMLIFLPGVYQKILAAPLEVNLSVIYLGVFPTVLPYIALVYIISRAGASEATSSLYLTPITACVIAWIWLGEVPTLVSIIGGGITILGIVIAHIPILRKEKHRNLANNQSV